MTYHQTKSGCKRNSSSVNMTEKIIFRLYQIYQYKIYQYQTSLWPIWVTTQSFDKTFWLMVMYHQTNFCYKRLNCSEKIIWSYINWNLSAWPWPWTQHSNLVTRNSGLWWCTIKVILVWSHISSSENITLTKLWFDYNMSPVILTIKMVTQFICITFWLMTVHHHITFAYKRLSGSENIIPVSYTHLRAHETA